MNILKSILAIAIPVYFYLLVPFVLWVNSLLNQQREGTANFSDKAINLIAFRLQPVLLWIGFVVYVAYDCMHLGNQLGIMYSVAIYGLITNIAYHSMKNSLSQIQRI